MTAHRHFGDLTLSRVTEQCGPGFSPAQLYPDLAADALSALHDLLVPTCYDPAAGKFIASIHSWVIRRAGRTILIDACAGNDKERPSIPRFHRQNAPYLDRLRAAGITPETVDFVMCTHLHADHCGWNTRLIDGRWVPTFSRARYLFSRAERDHWSGPAGHQGPNAGVYQDSVLPVIESGQAEIVDLTDAMIDNLVRIHPTPGHSPGHLAFSVATEAGPLIFTGDLMHQPIQIVHPELSTAFCVDPVAGTASRRRMLDFAAESGGLVCTAHFAGSSAGHVFRHGAAYRWQFA